MSKTVKCLLFYAAGVYMYNIIDQSFAVFILAALFVITAFKYIRGCRSDTFICVSLLLLGIILTHSAADAELKTSNNYLDHYISARGRICEIPVKREKEYKYIVDVREISMPEHEDKCCEKMIVYTENAYEYGETLEIEGILRPLSKKMNEDGFDNARYYLSKGVCASLGAKKCAVSQNKIRDISLYSLANSIRWHECKLIDRIFAGYEKDFIAVLKAVVTGYKGDFTDSFKDMLLRSGMMRFYYPAYLHLMIIMYIACALRPRIKRKYFDFIMCAFLIFYAMVNSANPVFLKVFILAMTMLLLNHLHGYVKKEWALTISLLMIGILNPLILFDSGLIISVSATVVIMIFFEPVYKRLKFIKNTWIRGTVSCNLICSVALIPLIARLYNSISVYSAFMSLIMAVPVVIIIILFPFLALVYSLFNCAPVISQIITGAVYVLYKLPILIDSLPFSHIILPSPEKTLLLAYVFLLLGIWMKRRKLELQKQVFYTASAGFVIAFVAIQISQIGLIGVSFVNVGQGDGAVVKMPYCANILIDGGGGNEFSDYNPGEELYLPYLFDNQVTTADLAVVSHYHQDHVEGIIAAMENIRVKELFMPGVMPESEYRLKLEEAAKIHGTKITYITEDTKCTFKNGAKLYIYAPNEIVRLSDDENDTSMAAQLVYGNSTFTFTGDMSAYAEVYTMDRMKKTDVLKVSHHGSGGASDMRFIDKLSPKYAVISVGENNTFNFPSQSTLERLKNSRIYRTDENGDITFYADKNGIDSIRTLRE